MTLNFLMIGHIPMRFCPFNCVNHLIFSRAEGALNYLQVSGDDEVTRAILNLRSPLKVCSRSTRSVERICEQRQLTPWGFASK